MKLKSIGVICGEDADLPVNFIKDNGLIIFPFVVDWDKYDGNSNIYALMRSTKKGGPKTSQPAPSVFTKLLNKNLSKFADIIVITVSSKFSGTYNSAILARKGFNNKDKARIHIVDSETSSGAEGLLVVALSKLIKSETNIKDALDELRKMAMNTHLIGVFNDPKWMVAGGRISAIKGMVVKNMLKGGFRPVLTIRDGEIVVKKIQMNASNRAQALFHQFNEEVDTRENVSVAITHADCEDEAKKLSVMLDKFCPSVKIEYIHEISPVVGSHLGPDTLLLSWISHAE